MIENGDTAYAFDKKDDTDEDPEDEDDEIKPNDALLVVAITEDEYSHLEIQLYNAEEGNLFVHHDISLPDFPLCLAWLDCPPYLNDGR